MLITEKLNVKLKTNEKFNRICNMDRRHMLDVGEPYWKIWDARKGTTKRRSFCVVCFEKTNYAKLYYAEKEKRECQNQDKDTL